MSLNQLVPNLFQAAAIGMALVGLDGRWLRVNPAICNLLGYTEPELLDANIGEFTLTTVNPLVASWIDCDPLPYTNELPLLHKAGNVVWVSIHASMVRDSDGEPHSFLVQFQDITSRRAANELEDRMFELPVALHYVAGFDGYFKKLSASWETALGYPVEYLLSVPYLELIHPDDVGNTKREVERVNECANTFLFENRYRHANGSYRWLLWTSVTSPKDQLIYGVALDYTKRKEAELELAQTVAELEQVLQDLHASQTQINKLREGLITICAWTKQIQHDGHWMPVDEFLSQHLKLNLTHGISTEAAGRMKEDLAKAVERSRHIDKPTK